MTSYNFGQFPKLSSVYFCIALMGCSGPKLVEHDVSLLVPLNQAASFLPASGEMGDGKPLVPRALFDAIHALTVVDEPDALYGALSTVSVRIDRCFIEGRGMPACRPQIRLVLQPVFDAPDGVTTRDAAIHVFFTETDEDVTKLVHQLSLLRTKLNISTPDVLAGAHPGFANKAWVDAALALFKPLLRNDRIVRLTSMNVHASNEAWVFGEVAVSGDIVPPPFSEEGHVTSTGAKDSIAISVDPAPGIEPALTTALQADARLQATPDALSAAALAVGRIENPAEHNPGTLECTTCHVAATAKWFLTNTMPVVAVDSPVAAPAVYADSRNLRAFGYFFKEPAISPRVQRETSAVRSDFAQHLEQ